MSRRRPSSPSLADAAASDPASEGGEPATPTRGLAAAPPPSDAAPPSDPSPPPTPGRSLRLAEHSLASVAAYAGHEVNNQTAMLLSTMELARREVAALRAELAAGRLDVARCEAALTAALASFDEQERAVGRIARVARRLRAAARMGTVPTPPPGVLSPPPGTVVEAPPRPSAPPAVRRKLLLVDDEPGLRKALGHLVRRHHDVDVVASGEEALARLAAGATYDVVLCDLMMPGLDGASVYAAIRQEHAGRVGAFVLSTGGAYEAGAHALVESGEVTVLYKPYTLRELLVVVDRVAAGHRPGSPG